MTALMNRLKLNWEAMEPGAKRKLIVFGVLGFAVIAVISVGVAQELLKGSSKRKQPAASPIVDTNLKTGPQTIGLESMIQDNAAYERRQLAQSIENQRSDSVEFKKQTAEMFSVMNDRFDQFGTRIDAVGRSVEEIALSLARERTQRRAENELIAQELDKVGRAALGSGNVAQRLSGMAGDQPVSSYDAAPAGSAGVVELSPFDMLAYANFAGMDLAHVGYTQSEYAQLYSTDTEQTAENTNNSPQPSERQGTRATQSQNTSATQNQNQPAQSDDTGTVDELGMDAYDRGELTSVPSGSLLTAVLVSGLDAPVGQTAQNNPHPVIAKLTGRVLLPNGRTMDLRGCVVLASGYGDLSTEKVYLQTSTLSCIGSDNRIFETEVKGSALGEDGKVGLRGRMVTRDGALIARNMQAGLVQGLALAFQGGNQTMDITTSKPYQLPDSEYIGRAMIGTGVSNSLDVMIQRYNRLMDQIFPVIEVDAGRKIEFQVLSRFDVRVEQ